MFGKTSIVVVAAVVVLAAFAGSGAAAADSDTVANDDETIEEEPDVGTDKDISGPLSGGGGGYTGEGPCDQPPGVPTC